MCNFRKLLNSHVVHIFPLEIMSILMFPLVSECEAFQERARLRLVTLKIRGNDVGTGCLEYEEEARKPGLQKGSGRIM